MMPIDSSRPSPAAWLRERLPRTASVGRRAAQRGVSLLFSLMTLVALSLAAVALIRSVDTGSTILGNLSFKQDTLMAADDASRQAIQWLSDNSNSTNLRDHIVAQGYRASVVDTLDPTGARSGDATRVLINWETDPCTSHPSSSYATCLQPLATPLALANGVKAQWFIMRVCNNTGDPSLSTVSCAKPVNSGLTSGGGKGSLSYVDPGLQQIVLAQYFRVIVRATGGRKTASTTETLVHF